MTYADPERKRAHDRAAYAANRDEILARQRARYALKRDLERGVPDQALICPNCGATRRTAETFRVHQAIAHPTGAR